MYFFCFTGHEPKQSGTDDFTTYVLAHKEEGK